MIYFSDSKAALQGEVHLPYSKSISNRLLILQAQAMEKLEIKHLSGKMMNMNNIQNPTIIKPGFKKIVPHLGFQKGSHTGNLIIEFLVDFPEVLTGEQIESLRQIL